MWLVVSFCLSFLLLSNSAFSAILVDRDSDNLRGFVESLKIYRCDIEGDHVVRVPVVRYYDMKGNLEKIVSREGRVSFYHTRYDSEERIIEKRIVGDTGFGIDKELYSYEEIGKTEKIIKTTITRSHQEPPVVLLFDNQGRLIEQSSVYSSTLEGIETTKSSNRYIYSSDNATVTREDYGDDILYRKFVSKISNIDGLKVEEMYHYTEAMKLTKRSQEASNYRGDKAHSLTYTDIGATAVKHKVSYEYEYDHKGNWISQITRHYPNKNDSKTCREITYYDDPEEKESSSIKK